jgi:ABC-type transport system involved in cytochrome bd biosynthesis fused ATPase/permease subunit
VERNQAGVINMKEKITNRLLEITGGLLAITFFIGIYISLEFLGILWIGELLYWIFMILISPLLLKAAYFFLKDIHQSNLEDIEEYQSEEKTEQSGLKDLIQPALKRITELVLFIALFYTLVWGVLFIFVPAVDLQDLLVFLSTIPIVIIFWLLIEKLIATIKDMYQENKDQTEDQKVENY